MRTAFRVAIVAIALAMAPGALAGGSIGPRLVREAALGISDSIRLRMLALIAQGDIAGAVEYYLLATGASTAPRWLVAMQRAFDAANRVAGPCQRVADAILEGFKKLGQNPAYVRFASQKGNLIGFEVNAGESLSTVQVSNNGSHVAVQLSGRIYDAFTGPAGLATQDYLARLINGRMLP